ncbi:protein YhfH [Peribacillus butanolivorans]
MNTAFLNAKSPECGDQITEQAESYLMECEHCLSKREDY